MHIVGGIECKVRGGECTLWGAWSVERGAESVHCGGRRVQSGGRRVYTVGGVDCRVYMFFVLNVDCSIAERARASAVHPFSKQMMPGVVIFSCYQHWLVDRIMPMQRSCWNRQLKASTHLHRSFQMMTFYSSLLSKK